MDINMNKIILFLPILVFTLCAQVPAINDPDPERFSKAIESFKNWDAKNFFPDQAVLFAGSSSIRLWKTQQSFPEVKVINRGFGGAHISDMLHYIDETVLKYKPRIIVFYCGDNINFRNSPDMRKISLPEKMPNVCLAIISVSIKKLMNSYLKRKLSMYRLSRAFCAGLSGRRCRKQIA